MASLHYLKQDEAILSGLLESAASSGDHCCYPVLQGTKYPAGSNAFECLATKERSLCGCLLFCEEVQVSAQELMDIKSELQIVLEGKPCEFQILITSYNQFF